MESLWSDILFSNQKSPKLFSVYHVNDLSPPAYFNHTLTIPNMHHPHPVKNEISKYIFRGHPPWRTILSCREISNKVQYCSFERKIVHFSGKMLHFDVNSAFCGE